MARLILFLTVLLFPLSSFNHELTKDQHVETKKIDLLTQIIQSSKQNKTTLPSLTVLEKTVLGFDNLKKRKKLIPNSKLTIIDYSLASSKKRMWIFDTNNGKVLYNCYVAHGKNSGREVAKSFSNKVDSHKSSLGFYVTGKTYSGKHGLSLYLDGQEEGFNDLARERYIVMHGASYVSEKIAAMQGYMGRSFGCPALPENTSAAVINTIKGGSALFIYAPDKEYNSKSKLLNNI